MYSLKEYSSYFEKLCRQHLLIKHSDKDPRFFRMRGRDVLTKLHKATNIICVLETPEFNYEDNKADNYMKDKTGAFAILKQCKMDDFSAQDEAVDICETIAHDFITIMRRDNRDYDNQKFGYLPLNNISGFKVGPVYDNFYGIRMEFKFGDTISMCVKEDNWNFNLGNNGNQCN